jgi:hypothetical protein
MKELSVSGMWLKIGQIVKETLGFFQRITYWAFAGYFIKLPSNQFLSLPSNRPSGILVGSFRTILPITHWVIGG